MKAKECLLLLFDRPKESLSIPKGPDGVRFIVPKEYLKEEFQNLVDEHQPRWQFTPNIARLSITPRTDFTASEDDDRPQHDKKTVRVKYIPLPSLAEVTEIGKNENFSLFIPKHQRIAAKLISLFMEMKDCDELLSLACCARERVNPLLFHYALSVALLHRTDTRDLDLPSVVFSFPDRYIDSTVFARVPEVTVLPENKRAPIIIPMNYTASNLEDEHRIAYFREDIGVNLHHWHWHLVYPMEGKIDVVKKDRRGELFYYMHQQIMARYNFERLCNGLKRVEKFTNFNDPILEAYYPKLNSMVANRNYPARVSNMRWQNLQRDLEEVFVDVEQMERWRHRIYNAIHRGYARDKKRDPVELTENDGIDILGNMVESSILSPDRDFYGDFHNTGHNFAAYIHDPDFRHLEYSAVMGDTSTAMRDPFFYRWHATIDDIFQNHKDMLPGYTEKQLGFENVIVQDIKVQTQGAPVNTLQTHWQQSQIDLSRGLDFQPRGAVLVKFTHLQHKPFSYEITVNNANYCPTVGTCRIFMAPKFDEKGKPWTFKHQKNMFIELDKFTVKLKSGQNSISRKSSESSVTIPFGRTFRDLDKNRPDKTDVKATTKFDFCGCGWPENMLIPKGNERFEAELFVMISDYSDDKVQNSVTGKSCDAGSYCGLRDNQYPDRRSMGYPFDRQPRVPEEPTKRIKTLQEFLTPNMKVTDVFIEFNNQIDAAPKVNENVDNSEIEHPVDVDNNDVDEGKRKERKDRKERKERKERKDRKEQKERKERKKRKERKRNYSFDSSDSSSSDEDDSSGSSSSSEESRVSEPPLDPYALPTDEPLEPSPKIEEEPVYTFAAT
uniref:Phenoloxidase 1-like n=1 Tax=Diabrotica virgifera virgifera TaxID=50390 RepID=A0A6P7G6C7_DIAVI